MGFSISFSSDKSGSEEIAGGSDKRLNVSSRADGRPYYNSRDESDSYSLVFDDANATALDFVVYLRNDKTNGDHMVVRSASVNGEVGSKFTFLIVTGTAAGGAIVTPFNLNQAGKARSAAATALATADSGVTPMSGLTADLEIDHVQVVAGGHEEFRFQDQLRLGQNQAIALRMDAGTANSQVFGVIYFYFEPGK